MVTIVLLIGIMGGIGVTLALYYPLYIYLPSLFIENFERQTLLHSSTVWSCVVVAGLLFIITGALAARWGKFPPPWSNVKAGSMAGFVAAIIAFGAIISPAAGLWGNRNILLHGLVPAESQAQLTILISDAVIYTFLWTLIGLWGIAVSGIALGGLGGSFIKAKHSSIKDWQDMFIVSSVVLFVALAVHYISNTLFVLLVPLLLEIPIRLKSDYGIDYALAYDPRIIFFMNELTGFLWVLFWQVRVWRDLRLVQKEVQIQRLSWAVASLSALILPIVFLIVSIYVDGRSWASLLLSLISVGVGIFTFREAFWKRRHLEMPAIENPFRKLKAYFGTILSTSILLTITLLLSRAGMSLSLVLYTISYIDYISPESTKTANIINLVDNAYRTFLYMEGLTLIVPLLFLFLIAWAVNNFYVFTKEYGAGVLEQLASIKARWKYAKKSQ